MPVFSSPLYLIVDPLELGAAPRELARQALAGGASIIQLRWKSVATRELLVEALAIAALADQAGACFIVNDRADVALAANADGVHLGQNDLPPEAARSILGPKRIIGLSTHNPEQVKEAGRQPVDYLGFGPIFPTSSKRNAGPVQGLEGLRLARSLTERPIVAIGGITEATMLQVLAAGADAVAVIGDVIRSGEITTKARRMLAAIRQGAPDSAQKRRHRVNP